MENLEVSKATVRLVSNCSMQSSTSFKGTKNFGNDANVEELLLDDFDSYMEDINNRLVISRMVNDSVIKGMVGAITEAAAENVAAKEAELTLLNERLHSYEWNLHSAKEVGLGLAVESGRKKFESQLSFHNFGVEQNLTQENLVKLKLAAEEQFQRLKKEVVDVEGCDFTGRKKLESIEQGSMFEKVMEMNKNIDALQSVFEAVYSQINNLVIMSKVLNERQWESIFQQEVDCIVFQSFIRSLKEEFEEKSHEQRHLLSRQQRNLMVTVDELSSLRQELDAISRSLFAPEPGKLLSHGSHELMEERSNTERRDRIHRKASESHLSHPSSLQEENDTASDRSKVSESIMPDTTESALKHMSSEQLINYFNDEIRGMKRNHEQIVHEQTEKYYSLMREYLKEKDSSSWRKDKEYDALRKKIPEVITKLEDILVGNKTLSMVCDDYKNIYGSKVEAGSLLFENRHLDTMLMDKRKEVKCPSPQVSDAADEKYCVSLPEPEFLKQINALKCEIEDASVEFFFREAVYKCILRELMGNIKCDMEDADIESVFMHDICMIVFRESVRDAELDISHMIMRYDEEKQRRMRLEVKLLESEKALLLELEKNGKLKQEKALVSEMMEEKEKSVSEVRSRLDAVLEQNKRLTDRESQQERLLCDIKKELDFVRSRLKEALEQANLYKGEKSILDQKLKEAMDDVKEAEREKSALYEGLHEKENMISAAVAHELDQRRRMKSVIASVQALSEAVVSFESRVMDMMLLNASRFEMLNHQFSPLVQRANLLKTKGLLYKRGLELRCSDLQKAEVEVDLLGDQVDALLSLLGKIYIGLDHYSPILQHYPGIMETLELIRRAIVGETSKPV